MKLNIHHNCSLYTFNTFKIRSIAKQFIILNTIEQLDSITKYIKKNNMPCFILGGGSNLILPSYFDGIVIYNQLYGIKIIQQNNNNIILQVMSGEIWDNFVQYTLSNKIYGLENLSFIPGTVGGAPIQNIGAYGSEVKEFIDNVQIFDLKNNKFINLTNKDCFFSYRNSIFKSNPDWVVIAVTFKLNKQQKLNTSYVVLKNELDKLEDKTALDIRNIVINIRKAKLPDYKLLGNVGSFFCNPILNIQQINTLKETYKNPIIFKNNDNTFKVSAGWLINNINLNSLKVNDAGIYEKHSLVIVNYKNATQKDIIKLAEKIQNNIWQHYAIKLQIEPKIIY